MRKLRKSALLLVALLTTRLFTAPGAPAQGTDSPFVPIDSITKKSLQELERLVDLGNQEKIMEYLNRVINGAGYIQPLAKIFYKLAQKENDCDVLAQDYGTILSQWPESAWAQKAVVEFVPIILMSGGAIDPKIEDLIWQKQNLLLAPAPDAASIGEDPDLLRADVFLQLVFLAHHRSLVPRVKDLQHNGLASLVPERQDIVDLAAAYAAIRDERPADAEAALNAWLAKYTHSELRAFAELALFHVFYATKNNDKKLEVVNAIRQTFPDTLEALMLEGYISGGIQ